MQRCPSILQMRVPICISALQFIWCKIHGISSMLHPRTSTGDLNRCKHGRSHAWTCWVELPTPTWALKHRVKVRIDHDGLAVSSSLWSDVYNDVRQVVVRVCDVRACKDHIDCSCCLLSVHLAKEQQLSQHVHGPSIRDSVVL